MALDEDAPHEGVWGLETTEDKIGRAEVAHLSIGLDEFGGGEGVVDEASDDDAGVDPAERWEGCARAEQGHVMEGHASPSYVMFIVQTNFYN